MSIDQPDGFLFIIHGISRKNDEVIRNLRTVCRKSRPTVKYAVQSVSIVVLSHDEHDEFIFFPAFISFGVI